MHEVIPGLYLADITQAGDVDAYDRNEIDTVIQLTHSPPGNGYPPDVDVHSYPMLDGPRNSREVMGSAIATAVELLDNGETLVVHCAAGESRSVAVCMATVAVARGVEFEEGWEVLECIKQIRAHPAVIENARDVCQALTN